MASAASVSLTVFAASEAAAKPNPKPAKPQNPTEVAHDVSAPLRDIAANAPHQVLEFDAPETDADGSKVFDIEGEQERELVDDEDGPGGTGADPVRQTLASPMVSPPLTSFDGLSNQNNFNIFGGRVNPPDPVIAVGPGHIVEMINLVVGVYDKAGGVLVPAFDIGALWAGFPVADCTDPSGDPVVVYDQFMDRWILTQFTTRGPEYFNCVAISTSPDPTGTYYRYAFSTGVNFPDYPKYGNWTDAFIITTREFGPQFGYGIGVYALEKNKMVNGQSARAIGYYLEAERDDDPNISDEELLPLIGDGLLPAYVDGKQRPKNDDSIPIIGTQDDGFPYGATKDALNIWELTVKWKARPESSLVFKDQLDIASVDTVFPCPGGGRRCLPQPGAATNQFLDILSSRQRPTWRLAYRNNKTYDSMLASQSVEASPGLAGMRWYEVRRQNGVYSVYQQGTYAPGAGVHRWMGSIAADRKGNIALGYSVTGNTTFPGIRYTGRLAGDPLGQMTLGEGTIVDGSGIQRSINNRWGDYTSLNLDPTDDCTFWYVNEYYTAASQATSVAGWLTRVASFKLPGCFAPN